MAVVIRKEQTEEYRAVWELNIRAFGGQDSEARLVEAIRGSENYLPELSFVAVEQRLVIGHLLLSRVTIETEEGEVPTLALAPMAVMPERQNEGIGSRLVREGLEEAKKLGYQHVVVLGHPNFYPRFGFVPASRFGIEPPFRVADEAFLMAELTKGSLKEVKGRMVYPPAFDAVM